MCNEVRWSRMREAETMKSSICRVGMRGWKILAACALISSTAQLPLTTLKYSKGKFSCMQSSEIRYQSRDLDELIS